MRTFATDLAVGALALVVAAPVVYWLCCLIFASLWKGK